MMTKTRAASRRWELKHPEHYKAIYTRRNAETKANGYQWKWHLKRKYGITPEQWTALFEKQNKQCAICGRTDPMNKWDLDHNHLTGKVRGILCDICNRRVLPATEHHDDLLAKARAYLVVNQ